MIKKLILERGSALITVLVLIVIITASLAVVFSFSLIHYKNLNLKEAYLQAKYLAEGGIEISLDELQKQWDQGVWKKGVSKQISVFEYDSANIQYHPWGGFLYLASSASIKNQFSELETFVGFEQSQEFLPAISINPGHSALVVTGDTRIYGDVSVGRSGARKATLAGRPYSGTQIIYGNIIPSSQDNRPPINEEYVNFLFESFRDALSNQPVTNLDNFIVQTDHLISTDNILEPAKNIPIDNTTINEKNGIISGPVNLICYEPLIINSQLELKNRVKLLCSKPIRIQGKINLENAILYSPDKIILSNVQDCRIQIFSEKSIELTNNTCLEYPSLLMVHSKTDSGNIIIQTDCKISGSLLYLNNLKHTQSSQNQGKIVINKGAVVDGLVYSDNYLTLSGEVNGMVITDRFYFYYSPTHYFNWIKDGVVDRTRLNGHFKLPVFFNLTNPRLSPLFYQ
jgi:hypothetical protein